MRELPLSKEDESIRDSQDGVDLVTGINSTPSKTAPKVKLSVGLAGLLAVGGVCVATSLAMWVKAKLGEPAKGLYMMATEFTSTQELAQIIDRNVTTSNSFPTTRITKQLVAAQIHSGGTTFTIYRFNFPQTCGKAGCLHVVVNEGNKQTVALQLVELPDKTLPFSALNKPDCFNARQPLNNAIDNYEICKPS
jgi:hypothetical protein